MLAKDWIADVELTSQSPGDDDETITGALKKNHITVFETWYKRPELLVGGSRTGTADDDKAGWPPVPVDDGERWLAAMMFGHKFKRGGDTAPQCADGSAAADVLGRQPDEYPVDDVLGKVIEQGSRASLTRHGAWWSPVN